MKKIITIATGTELMLGKVVDKDFSFMAGELASAGCAIDRHFIVGDKRIRLEHVLSEALNKADIVIMTGGLGPTTDDLTRDIISKIFKKPLILNPKVLTNLKMKFKKRNIAMPECCRQQALILKGARVIPNEIGTAPGMIILHGKRVIFVLPGPLYELKPMFCKYVIPEIKKRFKESELFSTKTIRTFGISEPDVQELMMQIFKGNASLINRIGYTSAPKGVDVRFTAEKKKWPSMHGILRKARKGLKPWMYGEDLEEMDCVAACLLVKKNATISVAESCTGGLISKRLTDFPGISSVFKLGTVVYSDESKRDVLNISDELISLEGAVSKTVALEMARNVREIGKTELGLSVTGIAGPSGGTQEKPVGLVWIGLSHDSKCEAQSFQFTGTRETIQYKASQAAFNMVRRFLVEGKLFF